MVWQGLTDLLRRETLHLFSYVANFCWIGLGIILSAIFLDIEINESRFDFHCGSNGDKELIRGKCYEQYENCLLYTSPSPRDRQKSRMPSSA